MSFKGFPLFPDGNSASTPFNTEFIWFLATHGSVILKREVNEPDPGDPDYTLVTVGDTPAGDFAPFTEGQFALKLPGSGWDARDVWDGAGALYDLDTDERIWYREGLGWRLTNNNGAASTPT